jgi:putative pyruvate formate lyase activating enzyme
VPRGAGVCGAGDEPAIARAALHFYEEPPVSGTRGSGTIFFCGCNLRCVYCQNRAISHEIPFSPVSAGRLADIFRELEAQGAHNINLVTASHHWRAVLAALAIYTPRVPVVYNTSGYDCPDAIEALSRYVSVWLPDFKYADAALAATYSHAADYPAVALAAIAKMTGYGAVQLTDGLITRGTIVRHLVLPGHYQGSIAALQRLADTAGTRGYLLSLMAQYTPPPACAPPLNRRVTTYEYEKVLAEAARLGFDGFMQARESAAAAYTPVFDGSGVNPRTD